MMSMEKRVLLAFILSTLVLAGWYYFFAPPVPQNAPPSGSPASPEASPVTSPEGASAPRPSAPPESVHPTSSSPDEMGVVVDDRQESPERRISIETPFWRGTFSTHGAVAISWSIKQIKSGPRKEIRGADGGTLELIPQSEEVLRELGAPFALVATDEELTALLNSVNYAVSEPSETIRLNASERREVIFSWRGAGLEVYKRFVFYGDRFDFQYSVDVRRQNQPVPVEMVLGPNFGDQSVVQTGAYISGPEVVAGVADKAQRFSARKPSVEELKGPLDWVCADDNYFALALIPPDPLEYVRLRTKVRTLLVEGTEVEKHYIAALAPLSNGQVHTIFAGPKDPELLTELGQRVNRPSIEHIIRYGYMSSVIKPIINEVLLPVLNFTYRLIPNYGVAILLITFVINMLFFPLKWKSAVKMKKAQALQPKMKELQQKIKNLKKDDPQLKELQMEQMRLMREANPLGGCLPMLLQLPVFWAFFILLTVSLDLRQAPFVGWINDLSSPDKLFILGYEIHVLPIAMCLSWMAQTFVMPSPAPTDPAQRAQQRIQKVLMGVLMPVAFTIFFFWRAPSGLVLYWMFNSLVGAGQQVIINRMTHVADQEGPAPSPSKPQSRKPRRAKRAT